MNAMKAIESVRPALKSVRPALKRIESVQPALRTMQSVRPAMDALATMLAVPAVIPRLGSLASIMPRGRRSRWTVRGWTARRARTRDAYMAAATVAVVLAAVGVAIALGSRRRARDGEANDVLSKINEALLSQPTVAGLPIIASVHVPLWPRAAITVALEGPVPTVEVRDAVLQTVMRELGRAQLDVRIKDRIVVDPSQFEHGHLEVIPG